MPLYDFVCLKCQFKNEYLVWSLTEIVLCPKCGADMERQFPSGGMTRFRHGGKVNYHYTKHPDPDSEQVGHQY